MLWPLPWLPMLPVQPCFFDINTITSIYVTCTAMFAPLDPRHLANLDFRYRGSEVDRQDAHSCKFLPPHVVIMSPVIQSRGPEAATHAVPVFLALIL